MIYLIICEDNDTCKIGFSDNPSKRLSSLQTGNPQQLRLDKVIKGDKQLEKELHERFKEFRVNGEWFSCEKSIGEYFNTELKEEKMLLHPSIIGIFTLMEQSEIRVYGYLLRYADGTSFAVSKAVRREISKVTTLNERTIYNTLKTLVKKNLLFYIEGLYYLNPRYAFKGSSSIRNDKLKAIIELGCKDC